MKKIIWKLEILEEELLQLNKNFECFPISYLSERITFIYDKVYDLIKEIKEEKNA